jgi:amino acid permease
MPTTLEIFGTIKNPTKYGATGDEGAGFFDLLSNLFKLLGVIAGIFFIVQIILAGYAYLSASGDPKKTEAAFATIWQSLIGLLIVSGAFVIASVVGTILGIDPINPSITGPQ